MNKQGLFPYSIFRNISLVISASSVLLGKGNNSSGKRLSI